MTDAVKRSVGNNLRHERWMHGWTQEFVAMQTGISVRTVSRAENGQQKNKRFAQVVDVDCALLPQIWAEHFKIS